MKNILSSNALASAINSDNLMDNLRAIESARRGTKISNTSFAKLIHKWSLMPKISIRGLYTPEILTFDILARTIYNDPVTNHRLIGLAYCLGRSDIPVEILEFALRDYESIIHEIGYYLCETADIPDESIAAWSNSLNAHLRTGMLHALLNRETIDAKLIENNSSYYAKLPADLRRKLAAKIEYDEELLHQWLMSSDAFLAPIVAEIVSCHPEVSLDLVDAMLLSSDEDVHLGAYRVLSERDDVPQIVIDEWWKGNEFARTAALAASVKLRNANSQMIEDGLNSTYSPMQHYAIKASKSNRSVPREKVLGWIRGSHGSHFIKAGLMACIDNPGIEYEIPFAHMNDDVIRNDAALNELCLSAYESLSGRKLRYLQIKGSAYCKADNGVVMVLSIPDDAKVRGFSKDFLCTDRAIVTDIIGDYYGDKIAIFGTNKFYGVGDKISFEDFSETIIDGGKSGIKFFMASASELSSIMKK